MAVYQIKKGCGDFIGKPDAKGNRITYKALDRIQSDEDLETKWPGRFTLISASDEIPVSKAPKIPGGKKDKKDKKTTPEVEYNRDGTIYKDMEDPIISDNVGTGFETPVENEHGVDVSKDFPTAAKVELQVFEKSKWFTVVDPDNGEVLNDKKLRKSKVEDFLADYLDENEDAEDEDEDEEDTEDDDEDEDEEE